jgi:hypothetical protein
MVLIDPVLYLKRDITKPRAIKYRILIRLKQFESCAISVKAFIPPCDFSILCIIYISHLIVTSSDNTVSVYTFKCNLVNRLQYTVYPRQSDC